MMIYSFSLKDVIRYYDNSKDQSLIHVVNFLIQASLLSGE